MRKRTVAALAVLVAVGGLYLVNASALASRPTSRPILIAQRGVHQLYRLDGADDTTCTARRILSPHHRLIENTLPSIRAAFEAGADVVEVDARRTRDDQFVLFHDAGLDCRTEGHGPVEAHTAGELQALDVGFGYTADNGASFPLRGAGRGQMATLADALAAFPRGGFLVQLKGGRADGEAMVRYIEARRPADPARISFFGDRDAIARIRALRPGWRAWTFKDAGGCWLGYLALGWSGHVPESCRGGVLVVPINLRLILWGWPDRLGERMCKAGVQPLMIGRLRKPGPTGFDRIDSVEDARAVPAHFDGAVWTDRIEIVGPALRR